MADPIAVYDRLINDPIIKARLYGDAKNIGHGDMVSPLWGNMNHHTGASGNSGPGSIQSHPTLGLCSQFFLPRDGKLWIVGYGIAWHGGAGSGYGIWDVNAQLTGMEMDNNGTEGWGSAQYWACVRINALIIDTIRVGPERCIAHKEWAGKAQGKWDPGGMNMDKLRSDVGIMRGQLGTAPVIVVRNEIDYVRGFSPWLGKALSGEKNLRGKVSGKVRDYEGGSVYWMEDRKATIPVPSAILETYKTLDYENGPLGAPDRFHAVIPLKDLNGNVVVGADGKPINIGDVQGFRDGAIQRKYGKEGFPLWGQIGERYARENWQHGSLGWATSREYERDGLIIQDFENGQLLCDRNGTVKVDSGDFNYIPPGR